MFRQLCVTIMLAICMLCTFASQLGNAQFIVQQKNTSSVRVDPELTLFMKQLFADRVIYLINQNNKRLHKYYLGDTTSSIRAMEHEINRAKYIQAWAKRRGIQFVNAVSDVRVIRTIKRNDKIFISTVNSLKLSYSYLYNSNAVQSFGIGTRHALTVARVNGNWHVVREWYLDPLAENPELIPDFGETLQSFAFQVDPFKYKMERLLFNRSRQYQAQQYNRKKAVAYADKYAGTAWGAGNKHRYNPKYQDYTALGGDCTNFASQCVGDKKEGGGLRMRGGWYYYRSGGSQSWVQTDAFKDFLLHSGYGRIIKKGGFSQIMNPSKKNDLTAIGQLKPGDLIGYEIKGDVDHFSVVIGFDANGYPLVNSHTADRYHVPFDLGWDKYTKYWLIHIRD